MAYTYDDFLKAAEAAGLYGSFSQYDLTTAQKNPEFGLSMLSYKQDYANAATDEARALANAAANNLRTQYGSYTGGSDGTQYNLTGMSPGSYNGSQGSGITDILNKMQNYGGFSYDVAEPTYNNQYQEQINAMMDAILNREDFAYNKDEDPLWSSYKKQYLREGERAQANTLGQLAAASGGMPSSYAATAAQQAGDYYSGQLADKIPELYQIAYDRYLNDLTGKRNDLSMLNNQEQIDYGKYLDSYGQWSDNRDFAYNDYTNQFNMLGSALSALQGQDKVDYGRYLDQIDFNQNQQMLEKERQEQYAANLAAFGDFSGYLKLGYSEEQVQKMFDLWKAQNPQLAMKLYPEQYATAYYGGGGGYRSSGGDDSGGDDTSAKQETQQMSPNMKKLSSKLSEIENRGVAVESNVLAAVKSYTQSGMITEAEAKRVLAAYGL